MIELEAHRSIELLQDAAASLKERFPKAKFDFRPHEGREGHSCYGEAGWTFSPTAGDESLREHFQGAVDALKYVNGDHYK